MRLSRNLLAGLANSTWTAIVGLIAVPLYLKYLGLEAYGLIGFFSMMQALFQVLDLGLSSTANREVARRAASRHLAEAESLLHTLAIVYWIMAGIIAVIVLALAPSMARNWLQSKELPPETIEHAVMLMGLTLACRWPIALYQGVLMGAQRLTLSSGVSIAMVTLGNFGAIAVLALVSSTIEAFFIWQAGVGLVHAAAMRWTAWRVVGRSGAIKFSLDELKRIWRFSAGMSGIALSSLMFTQLDKVILSKALELEHFGHYMLATFVTSAMYVLITPVFNVIYPRFCALTFTADVEKLAELYRLGTRLFAAALFPVAISVAVFSKELIQVWTGNPDIASNVAPIVTPLAIGTALNGVMHFPYALQLAWGMTWLPLTINIILMIVMVPLTIFFALSYGALGGAVAWLILEVLYVMFGTWLTHRHLLRSLATRWLFQDVGVPLGLSFLVVVLGERVIQPWGLSIYSKLACGAGLATLAAGLCWVVSPQLRSLAWSHIARGDRLKPR
jgi:O-antigen/teichoic acid export membrane protein